MTDETKTLRDLEKARIERLKEANLALRERVEELLADAVNNVRNEEAAMNAQSLMTELADEYKHERDALAERVEELEKHLDCALHGPPGLRAALAESVRQSGARKIR